MTEEEKVIWKTNIAKWNQTWFKTFNSCNCRYIPWLWIMGKKKRYLLNYLQEQITDAQTQLEIDLTPKEMWGNNG